MRSLNRRVRQMESKASMPPRDEELIWREVCARMTDEELRDCQRALRRCIVEDGWAEEDAPILARVTQLYEEVVGESKS